MKVLGANGIWSTGEGSTDKVLELLSEKYHYTTLDINSKIRNPFTARYKALEDASKIIEKAEDGDIIIAHSYGCLKALEAGKAIDFSHIFLLGAAVDQHYDLTGIDSYTRIWNLYSKGDWAVRFGSWLALHPFGKAGVRGFSSKRAVNVERKGGHNSYFKGSDLHTNVNFIHEMIKTTT